MPSWVRRWTGSAWQNCNLYRWDGSAWKICDVYRWNGSAWALIEGSQSLIKDGVVDTNIMGSVHSTSPDSSTGASAAYDSADKSLRCSATLTAGNGSIPRFHYSKAFSLSSWKTLTIDYRVETGDGFDRPCVYLFTAVGGTGTQVALFTRPAAANNGVRRTGSVDVTSLTSSVYVSLCIGSGIGGATVATRYHNIYLS